MSNETQPIRIETGEEVAFELMKFIAEKENKSLAPEEVRGYISICSSSAPAPFMTAREKLKLLLRNP